MKQWKNNHSLQLCTTRCVISSRQRRSVHAERCSVSLELQDAERNGCTCFPGLSAVLHFVPSINIRLAWITKTYHESSPGTPGFMHVLFNTQDTNPVLFPVALVPHWQNTELELQRLLCSSLMVLGVFPNLCNCSKLLVTELRVVFFWTKTLACTMCGIFPSLKCCLLRGQEWQLTQETTRDAVSGLASVFVQNTVIYRNIHQQSSIQSSPTDLVEIKLQ